LSRRASKRRGDSLAGSHQTPRAPRSRPVRAVITRLRGSDHDLAVGGNGNLLRMLTTYWQQLAFCQVAPLSFETRTMDRVAAPWWDRRRARIRNPSDREPDHPSTSCLVGAGVNTACSGRHPAAGTEFRIADFKLVTRASSSFFSMDVLVTALCVPLGVVFEVCSITTTFMACHSPPLRSSEYTPWLVPASSVPFGACLSANTPFREAGSLLRPVLSASWNRTRRRTPVVTRRRRAYGIFVIGQHGRNIAMRVAVVGSGPVRSAISRGHHAAAVGGEQHMIGIRGSTSVIDDNLGLLTRFTACPGRSSSTSLVVPAYTTFSLVGSCLSTRVRRAVNGMP